MLNLYQGDINKSLDDIERMFRFGELAAQGPTLIEELFGIAISSQAKDCALQIAIHNETNVLQLERLQQILAEFTPIGGIANRIDEIERYVALEFATVSGRGKHGVASAQSGNAGQSLREKTAAQIADFEEVVIVLNDQYDKCLEILKASGESVEAREAAMDAFESWMKQLQIGVVDLWAAAKTIAAGRKSKGNWLGRLMSGMLIPSVYQVVKAETRTKSKLEMARLHIAVRRFQKDTGQLPTSLDELTPKYLESLATDPFTDQPFVYTVTEDDFRIHSELWKPPTIGQDGEQEYDLGFQNTEYLLWPRQVTWEEFLKDFEY
jgi:hypothetical protein